jgi:hypothetical protein
MSQCKCILQLVNIEIYEKMDKMLNLHKIIIYACI